MAAAERTREGTLPTKLLLLLLMAAVAARALPGSGGGGGGGGGVDSGGNASEPDEASDGGDADADGDGGDGGGEEDDGADPAAPLDWWAGAVEEDAVLSLPLDGEGGLWSSAFVPPPPRPDFLDEHATPDGLTTCDLCTWAWHDRGGLLLDKAQDHPGKIGWALTLAIVSILSAAIGAVVMVTVLQCRNRLKNVGSTGLCSLCIRSPNPAAPSATDAQERARHHEGDKNVTATFENRDGGGRVWTWLTNRRTPPGPNQLTSQTPTTPAENHYTLDEAYTAVGEALYAELDRESSSSPAYQNTAYNGSDTDPDAPPSSAPSSAYYSDLSCATAPDRTYEAVGVAVNPTTATSWEAGDIALRRQPLPRLAAITETITVPSDYV